MRRQLLVPALFSLAIACSQTQDFTTPPLAAAPGAPPAQPLGDPACGSADDANNCGACGHSCLGGACSAGMCQPFVLAENQGIANASEGPSALVVDDTYATWTTWSTVSRVKVGGGAVEDLGTHPISSETMQLDDGFLYFLGAKGDRGVIRIPANGGTSEAVTPPLVESDPEVHPMFQDFAVLHGALALTVSYSADVAEKVRWPRLFTCDASPCTLLRDPWSYDPELMPGALGRSANNLYAGYAWPDTSAKKGTGIECLSDAYGSVLVTNGFGVLAIEETPDYAYVYGASIGVVARAKVPLVTPPENQPYVPDKVLASDPDMTFVGDLVRDGDDLYWVASSDSIRRVDKTGATLPDVVLSGWKVSHLALGKDAFYLTTTDGKVARLAKPIRRGTPPKLP